MIPRGWAGALFAVALASCGETPHPPPAVSPPQPPPAVPWPGDGLPGTLSDLEAIFAGPVPPARLPAALLRLGALREERARAQAESGPEGGPVLGPAIDAYQRLVREHPDAPEVVPAHYYLAHALADSGRPVEAQRVWRSLVCHDRYPWRGPLGEDTSRPELPQDRDRAGWEAWARRPDMEMAFVDPFPADCRPLEPPGASEPRTLGEAWWRIGESWFDGVDPRGGPFSYARAESAYRHAVPVARSPVREVVLYKLSWTWFKEQRYEQAVRGFVDLLRAIDEQQKLTGDPGADFRTEAAVYIAGALTYPDFRGPPPGAPYLARPDVLDTEIRPEVVEQKLHVAVDRVQDPAVVPQGEAWTPTIYLALADEYESLSLRHSAVEVDEIFLRRWPLHPRAPMVRDAAAKARKALGP